MAPALLRRLVKFVALDGDARRAVVRSHYRQYKHDLAGRVVSALSFLLHRRGSVFMVAYRPDLHYFFDGVERFAELKAAWEWENRVNNFGDLPRFYALYLNVSQVVKEGVAGDFAEVGVFRGNSARLLRFFADKGGRELFLFDTFAGFDARDVRGVDARIDPTGFRQVDFERVRAFVGGERTHFVRGYFPDSLGQVPDFERRRFAVVHLDCDLYEPVRAGLEIFYPKLERGGLLILHDYASGFWRGAGRAIDEFLADRPERLIVLPDKSGSAMFRKV